MFKTREKLSESERVNKVLMNDTTRKLALEELRQRSLPIDNNVGDIVKNKSRSKLGAYIKELEEENKRFAYERRKFKETIEKLERDVAYALDRNRKQEESLKRNVIATVERKGPKVTVEELEGQIAVLKRNIEVTQQEKTGVEESLKEFRRRTMVAEVSSTELDWSVRKLRNQLADLRKRRDDTDSDSAKQQNAELRQRFFKSLSPSGQRDGEMTVSPGQGTDDEKASLIKVLLSKDILILKQRENLRKSLAHQAELMELVKELEKKNKESTSINLRQLKQAYTADLDALKKKVNMAVIRSPLLRSELKRETEVMSRLQEALVHQIEKNDELQLLVVEKQQMIASLGRQLEEALLEIKDLRETNDIMGWLAPKYSMASPKKETAALTPQDVLTPQELGEKLKRPVSPIKVIGTTIKEWISPTGSNKKDTPVSPDPESDVCPGCYVGSGCDVDPRGDVGPRCDVGPGCDVAPGPNVGPGTLARASPILERDLESTVSSKRSGCSQVSKSSGEESDSRNKNLAEKASKNSSNVNRLDSDGSVSESVASGHKQVQSDEKRPGDDDQSFMTGILQLQRTRQNLVFKIQENDDIREEKSVGKSRVESPRLPVTPGMPGGRESDDGAGQEGGSGMTPGEAVMKLHGIDG